MNPNTDAPDLFHWMLEQRLSTGDPPLADLDEAMGNMAFNFTVLGPKKIMLPAGNPLTLAVYEGQGLECIPVPVDELRKANGAMGCVTGILAREKSVTI